MRPHVRIALAAVAIGLAVTACKIPYSAADAAAAPPAGSRPSGPPAGLDDLTRGPTTVLSDLAVGDCIDYPDDPTETIYEIATPPCDGPHDAEIFALVEIEGDRDYPGEREVIEAGIEACADKDEAEFLVDFDKAPVNAVYDVIYPVRVSWLAGDRTVLCLVTRETDDQILGSVLTSN